MRVKELLKQKGITSKDLAKRLGLSEGALSQSLNGNPTLERITEIATALDVPVSELFDAPKDGVVTCPNCGAKLELKLKQG